MLSGRHRMLSAHLAGRSGEQPPFSVPAGGPIGTEPVLEAGDARQGNRLPAPAQGLSPHLAGHGGNVVLEASGSCRVRLLQDGRRREAHRRVVAFARLRDTAPGPCRQALK